VSDVMPDAIVTFSAPINVADFTAGMLEIFAAGTWHPCIAVTQSGAAELDFTSAVLTGAGGQSWRLLTAPSYVMVPESGTTD